ncbi:hypothetical protein AVEN_99660-1 [Araneus ventricosus]|uniref:Tc1-like transposase DDE domain-containing protein n=1 Tax=Araneus ventricosus TaxID=182803 RepID=A0A4Y2DLU9_ARAVE|nr:hypothetical protein AVEN_99660-1 [Araneus ventricosus]
MITVSIGHSCRKLVVDMLRKFRMSPQVGISSDGLTDLYVVPRGTVDAQLYRDDILDPIVRPHACTVADCFILQYDNARPHRARLVENYLHEETIVRMG